MLTKQPQTFFNLVPQRDRRQVSDRRRTVRGGRRASDAETAGGFGPAEALLIAGASTHDAGATAAKPILH